MNGNFKVRCLDSNGRSLYTTGKIYDVIGGVITFDSGLTSPVKFHKLEDLTGWSSAKWEEVKSDKPTLGESITIRRKKSKVIATLSIDGEFKYSQYIKLVDANGDFKTAVKMVVERLMDKWDGGSIEAVDKGTDLTAEGFKVGDRVTHDRFGEGTVLGIATGEPPIGVEFDNEMNGHSCSLLNDAHGKDNYCWFCMPEELKPITHTIAPPSPIKKVKRPAKVGEWIEILKTDSFTEDDHKVGDIFQAIECTIGNSTNSAYYENRENGCGYVDFGDYIVLENYTPEVAPEVVEEVVESTKFVKAKVGDKIRVVKVRTYDSHGPEVSNGDEFAISEVNNHGVYSDAKRRGEGGNFFNDNDQEYIIIEETPIKPIEPIIKNAVESAKIGDKIRIIDAKPTFKQHYKNGDVFHVTRMAGSSGYVFTEEYPDSCIAVEEYEIVEEPINPLSAFTQEQLMKELFNRQGL